MPKRDTTWSAADQIGRGKDVAYEFRPSAERTAKLKRTTSQAQRIKRLERELGVRAR